MAELSMGSAPVVNLREGDDPGAYEACPQFGGGVRVLYRSPDGLRVAASFKESGEIHFVLPYDEFAYVLSGKAIVQIVGGERIEMNPGDAGYFRAGQEIELTLSDDFQDVTVLLADSEPIDEKAPSPPPPRP